MYHFRACEISFKSNGDTGLSMHRYWGRVHHISLIRTRKRMREAPASAEEIIKYCSLAGTLLHLGSGLIHQTSLVVSRILQKIYSLRVSHFVEVTEMLADLSKRRPVIKYARVEDPISVSLCTFTDAANQRDRDYGQTGFINALLSRNGIG